VKRRSTNNSDRLGNDAPKYASESHQWYFIWLTPGGSRDPVGEPEKSLRYQQFGGPRESSEYAFQVSSVTDLTTETKQRPGPGSNYQSKNVRRNDFPYIIYLTNNFFFRRSSLEDDAFVPLPGLHPSVLGENDRAHIGLYDKFHRIADDHDRDFVKKYDGDLDTTLIFVSISRISTLVSFSYWSEGNRPVCSPQSHPLSLSTFGASSNRTTRK